MLGATKSPWKVDKAWSDRFLSEIKGIVGMHLIGEPPIEEDAERNTDLIVLKMDAVRIACRVRKPEYLHKAEGQYRDEFTIRSGRPSGVKTEYAKIVEGWGDYLIYCFSDREESRLAAWVLCSLNVFRLWAMQQLMANGGVPPGKHKPNADGSSSFRAFRIADLPPEFVVARKVFTP